MLSIAAGRRLDLVVTGRLGIVLAALVLVLPLHAAVQGVPPRPNILWLTSEDNGPHLGAYGDAYADTPHLDRLAGRGLRYRNVWSNAPVCAPARTTVISGLYATATGSQHMRSRTRLPAGFRMFPQYLREAGYYVTNNAKEDYNLEKPGKVWDDSSRQAHWRNRPDGAPFFSVFNFGVSHESQVRSRPHQAVHDPAAVRLPAYHPDTPEVRQDWAQYYDKLTEMDAQVGARLRELVAGGLLDETIVFYWADHGAGLPRSKRTPLDTGLRVPLIVSIPDQYRHLAPPDYRPGASSDRLVGFVDLAPTILSLAGIQPPGYYQGGAFLGRHAVEAPEHLFGFRGRMDERYDMVRSVRDRRFVYLRNYWPHRPHGQHIDYMFRTPTTQVWYALFEEGRLPPQQASFWLPRPSEELYDLERDPDQVRNLVDSAEHRDVLAGLRAALREHILEVRDLGFLAEAEMHRRAAAAGGSPWNYGHSAAYALEAIVDAAELASDRRRASAGDLAALRAALESADGAIRTWGAIGHLVRGEEAVRENRAALWRTLEDDSPSPRIHAAEALARFGSSEDANAALLVLIESASLERHTLADVVLALNALDAVGDRARALRRAIESLAIVPTGIDRRYSSYVPQLVAKILADLE